TAVGVVAGTAITVGGLYWLYKHLLGGDGSGFGFGIGGSGKGEKLFQKGAVGPADAPGGTGGAASEPGGEGSGTGKSGDGATPTNGGGKPGGTKSTDKPGTGDKPQGTGSGGGQTKPGDGQGGQGGGIGGGSGGGLGTGEGSGTSEDVGEGGDEGEEGGGGDDEEQNPYAGWGDKFITVDLEPPDISEEKLHDIADMAYELVGDVVYETELPPPLHEFHPELGSILSFWADVILHRLYTLPPGRLDPENPTHVPWINLWLDILGFLVKVEDELQQGKYDPLPDAEQSAAPPSDYGLGYASPRLRHHSPGLWRAQARTLARHGLHPNQQLLRRLRLA
ncbi:MAG: hypothetical protein R3A51_02820, partial [Nannocystaceae bacterium]